MNYVTILTSKRQKHIVNFQKMKTLKSVKGIQRNVAQLRAEGKTIGFVPTMGALHEGHISLVKKAQEENDIVVVSIFVNPTQFNDPKDLEKYPRPVSSDKKLLQKHKLDILFLPDVKQIYPKNLNTNIQVDLGGLDDEMEGAFRPGHFAGVVQVVYRLLDIVKPDNLYMGQKDFQQFTIIQKMISELNMKVNLVVCEIMREDTGLAMSSRNTRLSTKERSDARVIYKTLQWIKTNMDTLSVEKLCTESQQKLVDAGLKPEYVLIADGHSLKSITDIKKHSYVVVCCAAWMGKVRLIDNVILKK